MTRCLVYIDLNMVRAGVVEHPENWPYGGYREIQGTPKRSGLIDYARLMELFQVNNMDDLRKSHRDWVLDALANGNPFRDNSWTESLAVGDKEFIEGMKGRLGGRAKGRVITSVGDQFSLREEQGAYLPIGHKI